MDKTDVELIQLLRDCRSALGSCSRCDNIDPSAYRLLEDRINDFLIEYEPRILS